MELGWERDVFLADGHPYTWGDVADHARRRGTWADLERETVDGLVALERALATGSEPARDLLREEEAEFRRQRRLISAEDMEAWLAERSLTTSDWRSWVRRDLCRRTWPDALDPTGSTEAATSAVLWATGRCSGLLERFARDLAGRVAVRLALDDVDTGLDQDAAFERFYAEAGRDDALGAALASHQLDWVAVEGDWVTFPDEDAAREFLLCLREDEGGFHELAGNIGTSVVRRRVLIDEVAPELRQRFLSAVPGDDLGPVPEQGGFALVEVRAKVLPSLADDEVRTRARAVVVAHAVARETDRRIRWHDPL